MPRLWLKYFIFIFFSFNKIMYKFGQTQYSAACLLRAKMTIAIFSWTYKSVYYGSSMCRWEIQHTLDMVPTKRRKPIYRKSCFESPFYKMLLHLRKQYTKLGILKLISKFQSILHGFAFFKFQVYIFSWKLIQGVQPQYFDIAFRLYSFCFR